MKNLFAFAFVACSLVLVSCGSKETASTTDTTATSTVVVPAADTTKTDTTATAPAADTTKPAEVKKEVKK
jgi:hypothetical protein